ncbi:MAG: gephyrin-like molybdotransferase Glp [Ruminococcus sp.]|jgi:molybdopterin molybdotransferase
MYPERVELEEGLKLLLECGQQTETEKVPAAEADRRVLAEDIISRENIPPFDRSPYDGYALIASDTVNASKENPVILSVIEEIPAGYAPAHEIKPGQAVKILTGAPVPAGATAIVKFEDTEYTKQTVTVFSPCKEGSNIVSAGEDVAAGELVVEKGRQLSPALVGLLAGLGYEEVSVYRRLRAALLSTGDELIPIGEELKPGKIRNSSIYTLAAYLQQWNVQTTVLGIEKDRAFSIAEKIRQGIASCDVMITTGGVSVGDYDMVMEALKILGARVLFWKVKMKPGMAFVGAVYQGKPILALSGNPSAAAVSLFMLGKPLLQKMSGIKNYNTEEIQVRMLEDFPKKSPSRRFLPGTLEILDGEAWIRFAKKQGNGMLNPMRNCEILGEIKAGSPPMNKGSMIRAYRFF